MYYKVILLDHYMQRYQKKIEGAAAIQEMEMPSALHTTNVK